MCDPPPQLIASLPLTPTHPLCTHPGATTPDKNARRMRVATTPPVLTADARCRSCQYRTCDRDGGRSHSAATPPPPLVPPSQPRAPAPPPSAAFHFLHGACLGFLLAFWPVEGTGLAGLVATRSDSCSANVFSRAVKADFSAGAVRQFFCEPSVRSL